MTTLLASPHPYGWDKLHSVSLLREDMIVRATHSHRCLILHLVEWLDMQICFGLLKRWARRYVFTKATPILTKEIPRDNNRAWRILENPRDYFRENDGDIVRKIVLQELWNFVNPSSSESTKNALLAHIEFGCGNYKDASQFAKQALCEVSCENKSFARLLQEDIHRANRIFEDTEYEEARVLLSFHKDKNWVLD